MKNVLNFIPGFRSRNKWKMIIASIYYLMTLIILVAGIGAFLIFLSMPFIFFYTIKSIKLRKREPIIILISAIVLFGVGIGVSPKTEPTSIKANDNKAYIESTKDKNSTNKTGNSTETKVASVESTSNTTGNQSNSAPEQSTDSGQVSNTANAATENQQQPKDTSNTQIESKSQSSQVSRPAPVSEQEQPKKVEVQEKNIQENAQSQPQQTVPAPSTKPVQTPPPASPTQTQEVKPSAPVKADRLVYYVPKGKSYHYDEHCRTLARSKTILSGNLQDVINMGKSDPCDVCVH